MNPAVLALPTGYHRIQLAGSFEELVETPWTNGVNARCWPRVLPGDFREIARLLAARETEGIATVTEEELSSLPLQPQGAVAREILVRDLAMLRERELLPNLDCIRGSIRDDSGGVFPTDVYSWHADSATVPADTYLCTYVGATSEGLQNEEAVRRIDVPETRALLLAEFGGGEGEAFHEYLAEFFYDLHYVPLPGARPFSFGLHNLWRVATKYPGCPVPPCVHRAPLTTAADQPRLLLIS